MEMAVKEGVKINNRFYSKELLRKTADGYAKVLKLSESAKGNTMLEQAYFIVGARSLLRKYEQRKLKKVI